MSARTRQKTHIDEGDMEPRTRIDSLRNAPVGTRLWCTAAVVCALVLPFFVTAGLHPSSDARQVITAALLTTASIVNVEIGRVLEGRVRVGQRPHKGLSAWAMAAVMLLPPPWLIPNVAITYAHARWRGIRVPLYKWVTSGAYLVLASLGACGILSAGGYGHGVTLSDDLGGLLLLIASVATFLAIESGLFFGSAYIGEEESERWLRRTLADPSFYLTEASVLTFGALIGLLGADAPWFIVLLVPSFGLLQQAVLHRPLQEQADRDAKTGLLRYEPWRRQVYDQVARMTRTSKPWAVLLADLDHFKAVNDEYGHLAGDEVLIEAARALRSGLRKWDLIARFGGEEFSILLVDVTEEEAMVIAGRLCAAVRDMEAVGVPRRISVSIGVAVVAADQPPAELIDAISLADSTLYLAKRAGRDQARVSRVGVDRPVDPTIGS
ncbi:GGDEF domain-containing protein [Nakamurella silvestris]|nr:GGDEF domain-containing protein [Nakamurella silvestris]